MIAGIVNSACEGVIAVDLRRVADESLTVNAVIDSGFSGCLLLPLKTIESIGLKVASSGRAMLADGQIVPFDIYDGTILWDGLDRRIEIIATDGESLLGMELLKGYRVRMDVIEGGAIVIERLPPDGTSRAT